MIGDWYVMICMKRGGRACKDVLIGVIGLLVFCVFMVSSGPAHSQDGKAIYKKQKCYKCHGKEGQGKKGRGPELKGNKFITEGTTEKIMANIRDGRKGKDKKYPKIKKRMPKFANKLTDSELDALVKYVEGELQK